MYKRSDAATPRAAGRRSVAFFVGAVLLGCAEPTRPSFPAGSGSDTTPPVIQIVAPPASDTIVAGGSTVDFSVQVNDASLVRTVTCDVSGAIAFSFPPVSPADTAASVTFPLPVAAGKTGRVVVSVSATDVFDNGSTKTFAFVVR